MFVFLDPLHGVWCYLGVVYVLQSGQVPQVNHFLSLNHETLCIIAISIECLELYRTPSSVTHKALVFLIEDCSLAFKPTRWRKWSVGVAFVPKKPGGKRTQLFIVMVKTVPSPCIEVIWLICLDCVLCLTLFSDSSLLWHRKCSRRRVVLPALRSEREKSGKSRKLVSSEIVTCHLLRLASFVLCVTERSNEPRMASGCIFSVLCTYPRLNSAIFIATSR